MQSSQHEHFSGLPSQPRLPSQRTLHLQNKTSKFQDTRGAISTVQRSAIKTHTQNQTKAEPALAMPKKQNTESIWGEGILWTSLGSSHSESKAAPQLISADKVCKANN
jgi:hypothetical protein